MSNTQTNEITKKSLENKVSALTERIRNGEIIPREDKIQVAVLADSPTVVTGFGNVCREILGNLEATGLYAFDIVGINYDGSPHDLPYRIFPAVNALVADGMYREPYGRQRFLDMLGEGRFDIVWVLQDSFIVGEQMAQRIVETNESLPAGERFSFIYYFPIDATPKKEWIDHSALLADVPIVYTKYGYDEIMKLYSVGEESLLEEDEKERNKQDGEALRAKLGVLYHGVNTKDFYPLEESYVGELRERFWTQKNKDKFIFINVNRNQPRKDLYHTLLAFKKLLDRRRAKGKDDVYLYLHCNVFDNNINLLDAAKQLQLVQGDEFAFPSPKIFGPSMGFPVSMLNELYNAADCVMTTTLGEGWGLSVTEAMATKKIVIAPDHTSLSEMLGAISGGTGERGILVKTGDSFLQPNDSGRIRPLVDVDDLVDKMEMVVEHKNELAPIVDKAYAWVKDLEWSGDKIGNTWRSIFENAYSLALMRRALAMDKEIKEELKANKIGRNEQCPVCNTKFKNCRHGAV